MNNRRSLSLTPRKENTREIQPVNPPIQFTLNEIMQHFTESMDSIKVQFEVADSLEDDNNRKTIWRSQVVLAEGLLDFYIHEMSKYCLFRMFTGEWEQSEKYASFLVPMSKVEEAVAATESKDWFFTYLNDRFSRDVFISRESMKDQLNLIGIGFTQTMVKAFPKKSEEESRKHGGKVVSDLFARRNLIAHQNDRNHASAKQNDISKKFVHEYISQIESIVDAIQEIALEKDHQIINQ